jgi:hypothetical protein
MSRLKCLNLGCGLSENRTDYNFFHYLIWIFIAGFYGKPLRFYNGRVDRQIFGIHRMTKIA